MSEHPTWTPRPGYGGKRMSDPSDPPNPSPVIAFSDVCAACGHSTQYVICRCGRYYDRARFLGLPLSPKAGAVEWRACPCGQELSVPATSPKTASGRGDWMQTYTGRVFYPLAPTPAAVCMADIAHALSQQCRYAGHALFHYSVAQHSVLVSVHVPLEHAVWGIMHDAAEAYLVDLPRPVKHSVAGYAEAEDRVLEAVAERFGLRLPIPEAVKVADNEALATEQRDVMHSCDRAWSLTEKPWPEHVKPWPPVIAEWIFLVRAAELGLEGADWAMNDMRATVDCFTCSLFVRSASVGDVSVACAAEHTLRPVRGRPHGGRCRHWFPLPGGEP